MGGINVLELWMLWVDEVQTAQLAWLSGMGTLLREPVIPGGETGLFAPSGRLSIRGDRLCLCDRLRNRRHRGLQRWRGRPPDAVRADLCHRATAMPSCY
jgi:hypothetical protein